MAKTIVFCATEDAAERMRIALNNLNTDMCQQNPDYVVRITGSDTYGKSKLDYFISVSAKYPVIAKIFLRGTLPTIEHYLSKPSPLPGIWDLKWHLIRNADRVIIADFLIRSIIRRKTALRELALSAVNHSTAINKENIILSLILFL